MMMHAFLIDLDDKPGALAEVTEATPPRAPTSRA
jgi:hypothetical protein